MSKVSPFAWWRRFLALPNESSIKTLGVAFLVALVAATTVSVTAVTLRPRQQIHIDAAREAKLSTMIATLPGLADILRDTGVETLDAAIVDLQTGQIDRGQDPATFDFVATQTDPQQSTALTPEQDAAGIGLRPNFAPAYLLRGKDGLALVVLPVYGKGYQSTIRAYLALQGDLNTIAGLSIYEQGETPGLGSRITDPAWLGHWSDKQAADPQGNITITLVRGAAASASEVNGITGATRSSTGVVNLVRFWMGPDGYGPFLTHLKAGEP